MNMAQMFRLDDGKPVWAIAKATVETDDGPQVIHLYDESELADHPEAESLEPPSAEILARAAQIEGAVFSRSEFERLLYEKSREELLEEENAFLAIELATTQSRLDQAESEQAALILALVQGGAL